MKKIVSSCFHSRCFKYFLVLFFLILSKSLFAQDQERVVVHLKDGREIVGTSAYQDTSKQIVVISTLEDGVKRFSLSEVMFVKTYQQVMQAPQIMELPPGVDTCRIHLPFLFELKAVGMIAEEFYIGAETAIAYRIDRFSIGLGAGWWNVKDVSRFPVFLQLKYNFWEPCLSPFLVLQAGTIFDRFTSKHNIKPAIRHFKVPGPKFIGIGAGIDYAVLKWMDISADLGIRYITIAGDVDAQSCDGPIPVFGFTEIYAAYFRIGIAF